LAAGLRLNPLGELTALPQTPYSWIQRGEARWEEGTGREGRGGEDRDGEGR